MLLVPPVPFHRQNTDAFCGPASVQMVITHLQQSLVGTSQATIHGVTNVNNLEIPGSPIKWSSFPDGIANALNQEAGQLRHFVLYCSRSAADLTQIICLALQQTKSAPIVLIGDARHWLVVDGFVGDQAASDGGPYVVERFFVRDPSPHLGTDLGLTHQAGDACGSGQDAGWPAREITIAAWYKHYLIGVKRPSHWQGLHLAICAEVEIPPEIPVQVCTDAACSPACVAAAERDEAPPRNQDGHDETRAGPAISRDEAKERARAVFAQDDFEIDPRWEEALAESEPAEPLLVQRRDGTRDAYYLVPFVTGDQERAPLLVILVAATGDYEESVAMPGATTHTVADITLQTLYSLDTVELTDTGEQVAIAGLPDQEELVLVWELCAESRSPYWPFYEATIADGRQIYIRIDGVAFSRLSEAVA